MRFFDTHVHLPSPDAAGLAALQEHAQGEQGRVGGLLILNTAEEEQFAAAHLDQLPTDLAPVPAFWPRRSLDPRLSPTGWFKLHPRIGQIDADAIPEVVAAVESAELSGLIVHCFPWGPQLRFEVSLPLVIALAQARPDLPVLATHGGGYESWALLAHTRALPNVLYDFSVSLAYYRGSDLLLPLAELLARRPERVLFGSDWPSAGSATQLTEATRIAGIAGLEPHELESLMLANSRRYWPDFVGLESP